MSAAVAVGGPQAFSRGDEGARWLDAGVAGEVPRRGARVVHTTHGDVAVFRSASDTYYALRNACPHLGGPLSEGIVHDERVTCPLHNWVIGLGDGEAQGADDGCTAVISLRLHGGRVWLDAASVRAAFAA